MSETESDWLTTTQAAARLGVTDAHLRHLVAKGEGPTAYRIGSSHLRFRAADIESWLETRRVQPEREAS